MYYHGSQAVLKQINVTTAATDTGKTTILVEPGAPESGRTLYYKLGTDAATLTSGITYGQAVTLSGWTALTNGAKVSVSTNTVVAVVEVDTNDSNKAYGIGTAVINKG